jgi:hypothetical protein
MFGLFKKKATQPLSVEEIEDSLYEAFLKFKSLNPSEFYELIPSHKRNHPKMCPKSHHLDLNRLHKDEIYSFIWMFIFNHMKNSGLRVNFGLFQPGLPLWKVVDEYVQRAREHIKSEPEFSKFWQQ